MNTYASECFTILMIAIWKYLTFDKLRQKKAYSLLKEGIKLPRADTNEWTILVSRTDMDKTDGRRKHLSQTNTQITLKIQVS